MAQYKMQNIHQRKTNVYSFKKKRGKIIQIPSMFFFFLIYGRRKLSQLGNFRHLARTNEGKTNLQH
jgi:hypothetical protein